MSGSRFRYSGEDFYVEGGIDPSMFKRMPYLKKVSTYVIDHREKVPIKTKRKKVRVQTKVKAHDRKTKRGPRRVKTHKRRLKKVVRKKLSGIEIHNLKKLPEKYGINLDLVDTSALIDTNLSYNENKEIIENQVKKITPNRNYWIDDYDLNMLDSQRRGYAEDLMWKAESGDKDAQKELEYIKDEIEYEKMCEARADAGEPLPEDVRFEDVSGFLDDTPETDRLIEEDGKEVLKKMNVKRYYKPKNVELEEIFKKTGWSRDRFEGAIISLKNDGKLFEKRKGVVDVI